MQMNTYTGIVEPLVTRLIVSRCQRFGINADEIDDLQQQIVPHLAAVQFDPARANGASPRTVMIAVIDRQLKAYLRSKGRYRNRLERLHGLTRIAAGRATRPEPIELRLDLEEALCGLSERDRAICQKLAESMTIKEIAAQLRCDRATVSRAIARIRQRFTVAGLRAWIEPEAA